MTVPACVVVKLWNPPPSPAVSAHVTSSIVVVFVVIVEAIKSICFYNRRIANTNDDETILSLVEH